MSYRIDTHVHLWNPHRLRYDWLAQVPPLNRTFLPADFKTVSLPMGVDKWVFVECGRDPDQNVEEAVWVSEMASTEPRIAGIVAHAAIERGDGVISDLAALAKLPLVRGIRRLLQEEADPEFCLRPGFVAGVKRLAEFGFSFDLCIYHPQLAAVTELVRRCSEVTFVLDHLGKPGVKAGVFEPWATQLRELAALPNVWCKISGLTTEADHARWQPEDLLPYLEHALECFGFDRALFGGDWPVSTLATSYERWVGAVDALVASATEAERGNFFRGNAQRCYRL